MCEQDDRGGSVAGEAEKLCRVADSTTCDVRQQDRGEEKGQEAQGRWGQGAGREGSRLDRSVVDLGLELAASSLDHGTNAVAGDRNSGGGWRGDTGGGGKEGEDDVDGLQLALAPESLEHCTVYIQH